MHTIKFTFSLTLTFLHTHPFTSLVVSAVFCEAEVTGFLSWPDTPAGTAQTLRCPSTTTMISRTCSLSGVWENVDTSLCTPFTSINTVSASVDLSTVYAFKMVHTCTPMHLQDSITLDNFEEVLQNLSGTVRGVAISEQLQTRSNLAVVAATFSKSVALISERTIISNAVSLLLFCL